MAQRRDSKGRFASGGSGRSAGGSSNKQKANPISKAAQNRADAKAAGMSFGAFMKQKAKAGRQIDKAQEQKRLESNRKRRATDKSTKKMEGRSWQEVRDSIRRRQGRG